MKHALVLATALMMSLPAFSMERWNCNLTWQAQGGGLQIIVGMFKLKGTGTAVCSNATGEIRELPFNVTMGGQPLSPSVSIGVMKVNAGATIYGVEGQPESLFGKYATLGGQLALIGGVGAGVATEFLDDRDHKLSVNMELVRGLGASVGVRVLKLESAE
ncbi:MAG: hypothetical protein IPK04_13085 [Bdellovibrionales bacterium]|nr:hypothetical protein [Bdellovibrionales bacterium]